MCAAAQDTGWLVARQYWRKGGMDSRGLLEGRNMGKLMTFIYIPFILFQFQ